MEKLLKTVVFAFFAALLLQLFPNILYYLGISTPLPVEIAYVFSILYVILLALSVLSFIFIIPLFISASTNKNKKHLRIALFLTVFSITSLVIAYIDIVKVTRNS
ncbi:MAG: hypothetical protein FWG57_05405 [Endomicrobia bacterium]|nr:hypothetical protein [Endomicrobiia bacterium]